MGVPRERLQHRRGREARQRLAQGVDSPREFLDLVLGEVVVLREAGIDGPLLQQQRLDRVKARLELGRQVGVRLFHHRPEHAECHVRAVEVCLEVP